MTLELGAKSPAIIDRDFCVTRAASSIAYGKLANAGQTCIAPDYALVHESKVGVFVAALEASVRAACPARTVDDAYSAVISWRHYDRLAGSVEEARLNGAKEVQSARCVAHRLRGVARTGSRTLTRNV